MKYWLFQGLLRFAIEARQENQEPDNVEPMDNDVSTYYLPNT